MNFQIGGAIRGERRFINVKLGPSVPLVGFSRQLDCNARMPVWACAVSPAAIADECEWVSVAIDQGADARYPQTNWIRLGRSGVESLFERVFHPPDFDVAVPPWRPARSLSPVTEPMVQLR